MQAYVELIENTIAYIQTLILDKKKGKSPSQDINPLNTQPQNVEDAASSFLSHESSSEQIANPPLETENNSLAEKKGLQQTENQLSPSQCARQTATKTDPFIQRTAAPLCSKSVNKKRADTSFSLIKSNIGNTLQAIDPTFLIYPHPPSDEKAKRVKNGWNKRALVSDVSILFEKSHSDPFLSNLAKAISCLLAPCHLVEISPFEKEKTWDLFLQTPHLKLVLCPKELLFQSKELLKQYRENTTQKTLFLRDIPLLLLADPSSYKKNSRLKPLLWNSICQALS